MGKFRHSQNLASEETTHTRILHETFSPQRTAFRLLREPVFRNQSEVEKVSRDGCLTMMGLEFTERREGKKVKLHDRNKRIFRRRGRMRHKLTLLREMEKKLRG